MSSLDEAAEKDVVHVDEAVAARIEKSADNGSENEEDDDEDDDGDDNVLIAH